MDFVENIVLDNTLERIADFLPYPFVIAQRKEGILCNTFINQSFLKEIGYDLSEINTIDDWFRVAYPDPQYRLEVVSQWNALADDARRKKGVYAKLKVKITTKHNGECWYEVKASITDNTHLAAFINLQELVSTNEQLTQLNHHKNKILSILSHDIRGPINNIHMLTTMAIDNHLSQVEFQDSAKKINARTFDVLELIETTLQWARSNFDSMQLHYEHIQIYPLVEEAIGIYQDLYEQKKIKMNVNISIDQFVYTDRSVLKAILRNLISNAIKFTPHSGMIHIESSNNQLTVVDNGIGITKEMIDAIMNRNYLSRPGTEKETGIGLGLKLIQDLLTKINAKMIIDSKVNIGTKIMVEF
jgi:signal transduction histidine kinase